MKFSGDIPRSRPGLEKYRANWNTVLPRVHRRKFIDLHVYTLPRSDEMQWKESGTLECNPYECGHDLKPIKGLLREISRVKRSTDREKRPTVILRPRMNHFRAKSADE